MDILAHRGLWHVLEQKNTLSSLTDAVNKGFGIETDIRDYQERLVISHNIADSNSPDLESFFKEYAQKNRNEWLALNVKADGIQIKLMELIQKYNITKYFLFDMSIPEMVVNRKEKLNFFTRHSDIESQCVLYEYACGVWLDSFYVENWVTSDIIEKHLQNGKLISIISSEIHGFDQIPLWDLLKKTGLYKNVMLCTDKPEFAREYFNE